ncbi:MAG: extracellular solute-binding protein [Oscillospiraceae bacterium]|jgi:ABC-type glycerol-3-phosphate transport system substrate-binding protein|nr:extracellular solute-binding protein [Oscillospiraceae bacterium]
MIKRKLIRALCAAAALAALASCGESAGGEGTPGTAPEPVTDATPSSARYTDDGRRIITIGAWQDIYYVSKHTDIYDDPSVPLPDGTEESARGIREAELKLAVTREIERKYGVSLEYVNLTFEGIQESINVSVPEGVPDVDIYQVDTQFGIPAVLNGYGTELEGLGGEARDDLLGGQSVIKGLKLESGGGTYLFNPSRGGGVTAYPLAFNMDMIRQAGLENPQDLYDRGEWTWEAWRGYLKALTLDTDGDGSADVYGYGGYWTNLFGSLLMSNGAAIAAGREQTLDSRPTRETLEFIYGLYNTDKTARPWDSSNWEINNRLYAEGLNAFWIGADWIFSEQGGAGLPFEIGVVPWPCGPSGDAGTNNCSTPDNTWYMIPEGAEDPELIFGVIFDWLNWYGGDTELAEGNGWSREQYMTDRNFGYAVMMSQRQGFDLWDALGKTVDFSLVNLLAGGDTPDGIIEEYAAPFQGALEMYFGE